MIRRTQVYVGIFYVRPYDAVGQHILRVLVFTPALTRLGVAAAPVRFGLFRFDDSMDLISLLQMRIILCETFFAIADIEKHVKQFIVLLFVSDLIVVNLLTDKLLVNVIDIVVKTSWQFVLLF